MSEYLHKGGVNNNGVPAFWFLCTMRVQGWLVLLPMASAASDARGQESVLFYGRHTA